MADESAGVLEALRGVVRAVRSTAGLRTILKGPKGEEEGLPAKGPVPVHVPKAYKHETKFGWFPHRIKYKGMFDLDSFYKVMALWFKERRFELHERLYKAKPPELRVEWYAERKRTSWVKEIVEVTVHMWGEYNVEAIVNGKTKKMAKVRMIITINGDLEAPYPDIFGEPRWTANNLERRLSQLFRNWVMQREWQGLYWDRLYYELYDLYGTLKEHLKFGAR